MTITARFSTTCPNCGHKINTGEQIEWERGSKARHSTCKESSPTPSTPTEGQIKIGGGSGYGYQAYTPGQVLYHKKTSQWLIVLSAKQNYCREDGMSFGIGDEQGYYYSAICREATEEEAAPKKAEAEARQAKKAAFTEISATFAQIKKEGDCPPPSTIPEGTEIPLDITSRIYGGGSWFVLGPEWIWAVENNGADGDDWSRNNVRTGGAGAIGYRIAATPELAEKIILLAEKVKK